MDDFVVSDAITDLERSFPFKELLELAPKQALAEIDVRA